VAFLGATEVPAGLEFLPHLKSQLAGVRLDPPAEAIAEWLPEAKAQADRVALLYYGSAAGVRAIRERFGGELDAILVGGLRPEQLPAGADPPLAASTELGRHVTRVVLAGEGSGKVAEVAVIPVDAALAADPALEALVLGPAATTETPPQSEPEPEAPAQDRVAARPPHVPKGLAGVGLTPEQVNRAIDRGSEFLWRYLEEKDLVRMKLGEEPVHVVACLALVHSKAHERFPDFDQELRGYLSRGVPHRHTYRDGILSMLVESYGDASFLPKIRMAARYLLEAQGPGGSWDYGRSVPPEIYLEKEEPGGKALRASGGVALDAPRKEPEPLDRRTLWESGGDGDTSNTQYATLGLHAASRSGIPVSPETWRRSLAAYRQRQAADGGFGYHGAYSPYASMTCAGICGIALSLHHLGEPSPETDPSVERGLAWLERNFSVEDNVGASGEWIHYYLYSLERVGRILDTEFVGNHEWYPLGARNLVDTQQGDGSWVGKGYENDPRLATSFALLFLTRATPSLNVELKRGGAGVLRTVVALPPRLRVYVILDCSGSMLDEMGGKQKFAIARDAVASLVRALPDEAEVALRVYGHRWRATEPNAGEDTELMIPLRELDRQEYLDRLESLRARGKTPLARSLLEAKRDLSGVREPVLAILLTDGGEDTLRHQRQDPLAAAEEFGRLEGVDLTIVGFDIHREDWSEQLRAMAESARGRYVPASEGEALERELRAAVLGTPDSFVLFDAGGAEVARGAFGESRTLPEGKYRLAITFSGQRFEEEFWINTDSTTTLVFDPRSVPWVPSEAVPPPAGAAPAGSEPAPPAAAPAFCSSCGSRLAAGARFCGNCGARVPG
jgi:hypothetical protein